MNNTVSIIIPVYNAERHIKDTLQSVVNQTYTNWELLIINDGSTDALTDMISPFLSDKRIKYFYQNNSGVSIARNNGIEKSTGAYIAFLDADDLWHKDNLEKKIKILHNENIDYVFSDVELIDEYSKSKNAFLEGTDKDILTHYLLWDRTVIPGPCSNLIIKRKCIDGGLLFDSNFSTAADQDFCFNLAFRYSGKRIPETLWKYRILANSMSRNIAKMERDHIGVYNKALKNNLFSSFIFKQKCFSNLYLILAGSWWVNAKNKKRGFYFIIISLLYYPPQIFKLINKVLNEKK